MEIMAAYPHASDGGDYVRLVCRCSISNWTSWGHTRLTTLKMAGMCCSGAERDTWHLLIGKPERSVPHPTLPATLPATLPTTVSLCYRVASCITCGCACCGRIGICSCGFHACVCVCVVCAGSLVGCEAQFGESIRDVCWLQNEMMFAAAQKR